MGGHPGWARSLGGTGASDGLSARTARFGRISGAGLLVCMSLVGLLLLLHPTSPVLLALLALAAVPGVVGFVGVPIWFWLLGRDLGR
jgi:hypothetical protein